MATNNDWAVITTERLDRHNDYIQVYSKRQGDGYLLSDCGDTMTDVAQSGCDVERDCFKVRIDEALGLLGVDMELDGSLVLEASEENHQERVDRMARAVVAINEIVEQEIAEQNISAPARS